MSVSSDHHLCSRSRRSRRRQAQQQLRAGQTGRSDRGFGPYLAGAMLWFYIENDTFFGPALLKRMHEAFTAAGGRADII